MKILFASLDEKKNNLLNGCLLLTHCILMASSIVICWTSLFVILRV